MEKSTGPWNEFQSSSPSAESGPWDEFKAPAPKPRTRGLFEAVNDNVIEFANAAAGGVSALANFVKPGNAVSGFIDENIIKAGEQKQSDVVQGAKRQLSEGLQNAQGIGDEVGAVGRYVLDNPLLAASQAAGSFALPGGAVKGAGAAAKALGAGVKGVETAGRVGGIAAGAAMAGGDAAGTAYDLASKAGATEDQSVDAGRQASVIPALVGGVTGAFGAERLLAGAKGFGGNALARGLKSGLSEAGQEAVEEGVTQFEGQRAAMPYDSTIDPTKGVAGAAAMGGIMGFGPGAVLGAMGEGPAKPSQQMGIDPNAGPLSRAAAASVDSQPAPQLGFSPLAGTPIIYPDGSVALNSEQEFQKRNPGVQQGMDLSKIAQPSQPLAAEKKPAQTAQVAPSSESIPLEQRSLDELRQEFRSAQDPAIRKTLAAEIRKRRAAMPDPLAPVQPQQEIALEPQATEAVQSQPQEAPTAAPAELGQPLTGTGTNMLGRGSDPLQSIIQGQADARRAADVLRGTTGASTVTRGDITPPSVESPVADVRSGGRNDDAGTAQPDANGDAGGAVGSTAKGSAALRPDGWRGNAIKAGKVARSLGLDPKGKRLKEIVAEIDAVDAGSNVQNTQSSTAGTEAKAPPVEARAPEGGNAASDTGVPAAGGEAGVRADGIADEAPTAQQLRDMPIDTKDQAKAYADGYAKRLAAEAKYGQGRFIGANEKPWSVDNADLAEKNVKANEAAELNYWQKPYEEAIKEFRFQGLPRAKWEAERKKRGLTTDATAPGAGDVQADGVNLSKNPRELNTSAEPVQKTSKNEQVAQADGVEEATKESAPASQPKATELTPKQFHEAKLSFIAAESGADMADVREMYDTEGGRAEHQREWLRDVEAAAKSGETLSRQTLDKLYELAPNARLPETATPNGYQRPEARKAEMEEKQARIDNRKAAKASVKAPAAQAEKPSEQVNPEPSKAVQPKAEPDYLKELFGVDAEAIDADPFAVLGAAAEKSAGEKAKEIARIRESIKTEKARAKADYDDWAGRVYKRNKTQVDLRGDGPSNQASMSVGAINESRRRNAMEALSKELTELDNLEKAVATDEGAARVIGRLNNLMGMAQKAVDTGTSTFKTVDEQFQYMLLDSLEFRGPGGKGNITSNGLSKAMLDAVKAQPKAEKPAEDEAFMGVKKDEPRNLVAMHNLTADNLLYADSIGGIPVPSIGITKIDSPFSGFGDVTLIAPSSMVDPEQGTPVFDRDAWTARFPTMNFKKVKAKVADAFYERMKPADGMGDDGRQFMSMLWEEMRNASVQRPDKIADLFRRYNAPKMVYAKEVLGKEIKVPMRPARLSSPAAEDKQLQAYWKKNGSRLVALDREMSGFDFSNSPEYKSFMAEIEGAVRRYAIANDKADQADSYVEMFLPDGRIGSGGFYRLQKDFELVGTKEVDGLKLSEAVRKAVPDNDPAYQRWVKSLVEPLFEAPTITVRGREVEPTLENIVDAMTVGATAGAEKSLTFGPGKTAAMLGKRFKSMAEIKADRDRVVSQAVEDEGKKATEVLLDQYRAKATAFFKGTDWRGNIDTWAANDASMEALAKAGKAGGSNADIRQALVRAGFKQVDQATVDLASGSIKALRNAATDYFEAKPQRAVKLSEFRAAVVPKGVSQEVKDVLTKNGIEVVEYNKKAEGARDAAIQKTAKRVDKDAKDILFMGSKSKRAQQGTPADRAVMAMAGDGKSANEILSFIANASKSPYRRQLAKKLIATGANPAVSLGGEMGGGAGFRFLAKYSRKNHEVTLSEAAADRAEQIFLHETVHAATLLALDRGGLIATQMKRLYENVKKQGGADGQYGMKNVGEFVAEAFTNPTFQKSLKGMSADGQSLWSRFVNIVCRILGMEPNQQDALSRALELGVGVMRENMPLRAARSFRAEDGPAFAGEDEANFGVSDAVEQIKQFDVKTAPKQMWAHYRGMALQALGRRQLVDLYGDEFGTHMHQYDEHVQRMEAEKNETGAEADDLAQRWGKLKDEKALAELMHDATLAQMDPDKPMPDGYSKAEYDRLKTRFNTLSPEAKDVYREARDMYVRHYKAVQQAIKDRIERSDMSPGQKRKLMADLDDKLFKELKGVYFPLSRFGQYVIVVKDANGEVKNVTRAETVKEAEQARKELQKAFPASMGNTVGKVLKQAEFNAGRDAVGKGFMADLMNALDEKGVDDELRDTVAQLYLSSLPDLSWAKHGIHRKGTPGFSQDARRAFAQNAFHGARYLAKLRYSDQLQDELTAMQDYVKSYEGVEEYDSVQGQQVVDEMVKRHEWLMNPKASPVSTALTSFGFLFHMGLSPASAMVNLTQTALVAYPQMGAKWGFGKAGAALTKASEEVVRAKNDLSKSLKGAELAAFERATRDGTIDVTMAHDLAGIAQGEDQGVMWKIRPVMRWASFMFHHAEKFNRQATFLAAYRLSKDANPEKSEDWHYEEAKKATYDGHFDYSSANRARMMQGNWQRVILLFKQYAQSMVYTLARNAYQSVKALDPKERAQARKALGGILAAHAAAAGVLGLPIVGPLLTVASWIGGDDDEPWDAEVAMQNAMAEMIGPKAAEVVARGFSRLTPFDLSGRVALNKLILPDVQEGLEGKEWAESAMASALGPVAGIGVNIARGAQKITEGDYMRGLEDMMPTALRGPLKAIRYNIEGAQDKTGITITDDVSLAGEFGQASGFSPSQVRRDTERRSAIYSYDRALTERRSVLMRMFADAQMAGDTETAQEVREDIQRFNEKNPTRRITPMNLAQSIRNRRKRVEQAEQGVYLPKNRRDALDAVSF